MNVKYKRYIRFFLISFFLLILTVALTVGVIDPFFHYHAPIGGVNYIIDDQIHQNPGIAQNFKYDSVILGSSMTANFDTDLFARTMGLNTVKLSYNAAYPKDIDNIMQLVNDSPNQIKQVFLGIDVNTYRAAPGITAYSIPEYLYDDSMLNDVSYLLNKDVLLDYIILPQVKQESTPLNEIYCFWRNLPCGKEYVAIYYDRPEEFNDMLPADTYRDNIDENMRTYILPYIESMPDTQFTVFFPPYSILYWYTQYAEGNLEAELEGERQIMEQLFAFPNVRVYYFQNDYDFITDLNNYSDYTHYTHEMNDQMTLWFAEDDCPYEVSAENYEEVLSAMEEWLGGCDYEKYLPY